MQCVWPIFYRQYDTWRILIVLPEKCQQLENKKSIYKTSIIFVELAARHKIQTINYHQIGNQPRCSQKHSVHYNFKVDWRPNKLNACTKTEYFISFRFDRIKYIIILWKTYNATKTQNQFHNSNFNLIWLVANKYI